jgi:hypothetical protein
MNIGVMLLSLLFLCATLVCKTNNNNNTMPKFTGLTYGHLTPMFIGLNRTTQKHGCHKRKIAWERIKSYVLK